MRNDVRLLLDAAVPHLTPCSACPLEASCAFTTARYQPGVCLHEYKLAHAFMWRRVRDSPPAGAADFARLDAEVRRYAQWLAQVRPFDHTREVNAPPQGPGIPFGESGQSNLLAFAGT